ncbi:hypothetical protein [Dehalococcoides mccartyi]|uniref:Uncharacterized protein n=1 Tax=Dehalococcoides mccartyi (strain VS) TaxID=311424 RepID=D2BII6_DEHMV|nr:hypothetical protein [Dehalococcoides mccartyi]ACZ62136.1 hypothetical protein DhcVS_1019 [Dehalococcoides mccartyi VS]
MTVIRKNPPEFWQAFTHAYLFANAHFNKTSKSIYYQSCAKGQIHQTRLSGFTPSYLCGLTVKNRAGMENINQAPDTHGLAIKFEHRTAGVFGSQIKPYLNAYPKYYIEADLF